MNDGGERLDAALVMRGLVTTRARARDLVLRGKVEVDGRVVTKPATGVASQASIAVTAAEEVSMVSRGRLKLAAALDVFGLTPADRTCLDLGASTGGFTEVLLQRGAAMVYAVDVGHGQLHASLKSEPRVVSMEGRDARSLTAADFARAPAAVVADLSFISLSRAVPAALSLTSADAWLVLLVKPQFEVGPEHVSKSGIVRNDAVRRGAVASVADWLSQQGWCVHGDIPSPISGGDGNVEYLIGAVRRP